MPSLVNYFSVCAHDFSLYNATSLFCDQLVSPRICSPLVLSLHSMCSLPISFPGHKLFWRLSSISRFCSTTHHLNCHLYQINLVSYQIKKICKPDIFPLKSLKSNCEFIENYHPFMQFMISILETLYN